MWRVARSRNVRATDIRKAFARFVIQQRFPQIRPAQLEREVPHVHLPFTSYQVSTGKSTAGAFYSRYTIHAQPHWRSPKGRLIPGRFDTVLVDTGRRNRTGALGMYDNLFTILIY